MKINAQEEPQCGFKIKHPLCENLRFHRPHNLKLRELIGQHQWESYIMGLLYTQDCADTIWSYLQALC